MQNDDFNIDVVIAEITAFAENMHAKNQHKKKGLLKMYDDNSFSIHDAYVYHGYS